MDATFYNLILNNNNKKEEMNDKAFIIDKNKVNDFFKKVYLVYGDTELETSYEIAINIFGIFDIKEQAIRCKKMKEIEYFKLNKEYLNSRSEVNFNILEIDLNKIIDKHLGGYIE